MWIEKCHYVLTVNKYLFHHQEKKKQNSSHLNKYDIKFFSTVYIPAKFKETDFKHVCNKYKESISEYFPQSWL